MTAAAERERRQTAGNRLKRLLEQQEDPDDEFYGTAYGGFLDVRKKLGSLQFISIDIFRKKKIMIIVRKNPKKTLLILISIKKIKNNRMKKSKNNKRILRKNARRMTIVKVMRRQANVDERRWSIKHKVFNKK